jgi:ribosome-associated protein
MTHRPETSPALEPFSSDIRLTPRVRVPASELEFDFTHSSGPGGQNVNKLSSKAILHWSLARNSTLPPDLKERFHVKFKNKIRKDGVVVLSSQRTRDAHSNRQDCIDKLKAMLMLVLHAPKKRKKTKPTREGREKRLQGKHIRSEKKASRKKPRIGESD